MKKCKNKLEIEKRLKSRTTVSTNGTSIMVLTSYSITSVIIIIQVFCTCSAHVFAIKILISIHISIIT